MHATGRLVEQSIFIHCPADFEVSIARQLPIPGMGKPEKNLFFRMVYGVYLEEITIERITWIVILISDVWSVHPAEIFSVLRDSGAQEYSVQGSLGNGQTTNERIFLNDD